MAEAKAKATGKKPVALEEKATVKVIALTNLKYDEELIAYGTKFEMLKEDIEEAVKVNAVQIVE